MKRFWTIFCRSLGALIFSVSTGLASECSNDPNECTPKNLCAAATSQKDGNTIWSDASSASKHVSFAQELGINCGVVEIVDPCDTDANECKISQLCEKATVESNKRTVWNSGAETYVKLAKEYGLTCGVKKEVVEAKNSSCLQEPKNCQTGALCNYAIRTLNNGSKIWESRSNYSGHVTEAKRRGLSCGVTIMVTSSVKNCKVVDKDNTYECTDESICRLATNGYHGDKNWTKISRYLTFVSEAKRRGLTCDVKEKAEKCSSKTPQHCDATELCKQATVKAIVSERQWAENSFYLPFVKEAKRRGLDCGVAEMKTTAPKAKTAPNAKTPSAIALEASKRTCPSSGIWNNCTNTYLNKNGNKWIGRRINNDLYGTITYLSLEEGQWKGDVRIGQRKNDKWYGPSLYVWRGGGYARFDLEVPQDFRANSTVNEVFPELKRMFNALSRQERLTAQRSMAKKGLYSSTIDGAWGRNTLIGLGRFSAEHLNTINLKSKRNIQLVLDGLLAQESRSKTKMAPLATLEKVAERDAGFVKAASSSSIMKNAFIKESLLKRKQIQYALKQLGYYRSGIDGLWGNGTSSALTSFQSEEGLLSSSSSQVFRRILSEVSVPTSFAAPKKIITRNDPPKKSAQGYTKAQAEAICEPQAKLAGRQATSAYRPRNQSIDCFDYGSIMSCSQGSSGGFWGGMLEGMEKSSARKQAYNAVKDSCMAQYGWY